MNVRNVIIFIIVALILAIAVHYFVAHTDALEMSVIGNSSYVVVEDEINSTEALYKEAISSLPKLSGDGRYSVTSISEANEILAYITNKTPVRIQQSDCVFPGETIDIGGMGWYSGHLDYFGMYFDEFSISENQTPLIQIDIPYSPRKASWYYVDPEIYNDRFGWWYVHYDTDESKGNSRAFKVLPYCKTLVDGVMAIQTVTNAENETLNETKRTPELLGELWDTSDVLLARGDWVAIETPSRREAKIWVFGNPYAAYDFPSQGNNVVFNSTLELGGFASGMYNVSIVDPGKNDIYEVEYEPQHKMWQFSNVTHPILISPFRSVDIVDIYGLSTFEVEKRFLAMEHSSRDDTAIQWKLNFMEPEIRVMRIDQHITSPNYSYVDVRGYTNAINGTKITMRIDQSKLGNLTNDPDYNAVWVTNATGRYANAWRQFGYRIQVDTNELSPGQHYFTLTNPQGALAIVPFYVYRELPAHYQPPEYIQYIGNSPFIPTPTPEKIIEQVTVQVPVEVIKTVVEPFNYQKLIETFISKYVLVIVLTPLGIISGWWVLTLAARAIKRKNDEQDIDLYEEE